MAVWRDCRKSVVVHKTGHDSLLMLDSSFAGEEEGSLTDAQSQILEKVLYVLEYLLTLSREAYVHRAVSISSSREVLYCTYICHDGGSFLSQFSSL